MVQISFSRLIISKNFSICVLLSGWNFKIHTDRRRHETHFRQQFVVVVIVVLFPSAGSILVISFEKIIQK
jgi:hypothetical protein